MGEEGERGREGIKDAKEQIYYCSAAMKRDLDERRKKVETRARSRGRGRASELGQLYSLLAMEKRFWCDELRCSVNAHDRM